jgi:GntR family transcriptional repressor for pyruvate dehydrogenase complex
MERDFLAENVSYLTKDLGKCNISQNLFQRFKELIMSGVFPTGYMLPNENIVSDMLGVGRSTLREAYTALAVFGFIRRSKAGTFINEIAVLLF